MKTLLTASLTLISCTLPVSAAQIVLATHGQPQATIVIPANPAPKISLAAAELQHYVQAICGVELPLRQDGKRVEGVGLYIGECEVIKEGDLPAKELNPETYAIRVRDGNLLFLGRFPTPTYFAVVSFIEDYLGVRWFAPGELWEYVPQGKRGELKVNVSEVVKTPDTSPRIWSGHAWFDSWQAWNLRNKTVQSEVVPRRQFQNFLHRVFPPEKYGKDHPEYYPLVNGQRWIPPAGSSFWRPCESNPEVVRLTVEYARKWFDENPNIDSFSLGMDDISHLCSCPNCRALDPHPDSYEKGEFSDRHYKFVNAVAREIKKTHPDRYIGTLIYSIARKPPETVPKLEDNVFGFITETSALWWDEKIREADHALTREWARRCKHLSRYDYYGFACLTPRYYPHHVDEQIKFDKSLGLEGMYTEVYTFLPHTAPMIWAFAKLQWNHHLNVDNLLNEFFTKMYGTAAPIMKRYFDLLERSYNTPRPGRRGWEHRNIVNQALTMSVEDLDEGLRLLDRALTVAKDEKVKARIEIHRAALQYASYAIRPYWISQKLATMAVTDEHSAAEALRLSAQLSALAAEREKFWEEAPKRNDLLGETLRGLSSIKYLATGQVANLEKGGVVGTTRALAWYAQHAPEKLASVVADLHAMLRGPIGDRVKAWLWVEEHKPPNLLANPGFEEEGRNERAAEMDWKAVGAPRGWSTWSATTSTTFAVRSAKGLKDSAAASISNAQSACFLQTLRVSAGEKYLITCWVKPEPAGKHCGAYLAVRFRDEKGAWHQRTDLEPLVSITEDRAEWQPLTVMVTVPEGAGSLVVMLGARGQSEGAEALYDEAAVHRIPAELN